MTDIALDARFTEAERGLFMERMFGLLSVQAEKYLAGESTSVTVEKAGELMRSLNYTIGLALREAGLPERALLTEDLTDLLRQGREILRGKVRLSKLLWQRACITAPKIRNAYYADTLSGLGRFFRRYDLYYSAHEIPCSIDYPLCVPVSESEPGVSYVELWLRRLLLENRLMSRFDEGSAERVLVRSCPDYVDMPLNMCEPPLINAIGLGALKKPPFSLELRAKDIIRLGEIFSEAQDMAATLGAAARYAAAQLAPGPDSGAEGYLMKIAEEVRPRLEAALEAGNLAGVFI